MLKQVERFRLVDLVEPRYNPVQISTAKQTSSEFPESPPAAAVAAPKACDYSSDEFRMYAFKIKRCPKNRAHDWTQCPYAHRGEKARRRDPTRFNYTGIACPDFRHGGGCPRGDACEYAHGVFEFWLHPARYRTRACKAGRYCQRKVCFFAHTPEQLRSGTKYTCRCARGAPAPPPSPENCYPYDARLTAGEYWDFLEESLRGLRIGDRQEYQAEAATGETSDTPDIDWVWELLN